MAHVYDDETASTLETVLRGLLSRVGDVVQWIETSDSWGGAFDAHQGLDSLVDKLQEALGERQSHVFVAETCEQYGGNELVGVYVNKSRAMAEAGSATLDDWEKLERTEDTWTCDYPRSDRSGVDYAMVRKEEVDGGR